MNYQQSKKLINIYNEALRLKDNEEKKDTLVAMGEHMATYEQDISKVLEAIKNSTVGALLNELSGLSEEKANDYINSINAKIAADEHAINVSYDKQEKECLNRIENDYGVKFKYTAQDSLEEAINVIEGKIDYDIFKELFKEVDSEITTDKGSKKVKVRRLNILYHYLSDEKLSHLERAEYEDVQNAVNKFALIENTINEYKSIGLSEENVFDLFITLTKDSIPEVVSSNSELYKNAYRNAYSVQGVAKAKANGLFSDDVKIDVLVLLKYLLKKTLIEEKICDEHKEEILGSNRFIKNNGYQVCKNNLPALKRLREEYGTILTKRLKDKQIISLRKKEVPSIEASLESKIKYLKALASTYASYDENFEEDLINSSALAKTLSVKDGVLMVPQRQFNYNREGLISYINYYINLKNQQEEFKRLLISFKENECFNIKANLEFSYFNSESELEKVNSRLAELEQKEKIIIPTHTNAFVKFFKKLFNSDKLAKIHDEVTYLKNTRAEIIDDLKQNNSNIKENNKNIINLFNQTFKNYLKLFNAWHIDINLGMITNYNSEELARKYDDSIDEAIINYKKFIAATLMQIAQNSGIAPKNIATIAKERFNLSVAEPNLEIVETLDNLVNFLNNYSSNGVIVNDSLLAIVREVKENGITLNVNNVDEIINGRIRALSNPLNL